MANQSSCITLPDLESRKSNNSALPNEKLWPSYDIGDGFPVDLLNELAFREVVRLKFATTAIIGGRFSTYSRKRSAPVGVTDHDRQASKKTKLSRGTKSKREQSSLYNDHDQEQRTTSSSMAKRGRPSKKSQESQIVDTIDVDASSNCSPRSPVSNKLLDITGTAETETETGVLSPNGTGNEVPLSSTPPLPEVQSEQQRETVEPITAGPFLIFRTYKTEQEKEKEQNTDACQRPQQNLSSTPLPQATPFQLQSIKIPKTSAKLPTIPETNRSNFAIHSPKEGASSVQQNLVTSQSVCKDVRPNPLKTYSNKKRRLGKR